MSIKLEGSCLCGNHSYVAEGEVLGFYHCHCQRCQKKTGTGHASNILLKPATLEVTGDAAEIGVYKVPDSERFSNNFCKNCGGPVPRATTEIQMVMVPAGTLDSPIEIEPEARIFWESRAEWSCSDKEVPKFDEYVK